VRRRRCAHERNKFCSRACAFAFKTAQSQRRQTLKRLLQLLRRELRHRERLWTPPPPRDHRAYRLANRERTRAATRARRDQRLPTGSFCLLACPNCGGRMPHLPDHRRWCSDRCAHQMRKKYSFWTGLTGAAQYEMLLTVGLMKQANRVVEDWQKGNQQWPK
jgi:hypothetical protein